MMRDNAVTIKLGHGLVDAMRRRAHDHSWKHQHVFWNSIDPLSSVEDIYHRLRMSGATPDELRVASTDMQKIRKRFRNYFTNELFESVVQLAQDVVDLYADMSDQLLEYQPMPKGLSKAKQVEHVLRSTRGHRLIHAIPDRGEFGVVVVSQSSGRKYQTLFFDDGSVFTAPSSIYAHDPGTVGARKVIHNAIADAKADPVGDADDIRRLYELLDIERSESSSIPTVADDDNSASPFVIAWIRNQYNRGIESYKHPGQAVAAVRDDLQRAGVNPSSWKSILRLSQHAVDTITKQPIKRNHIAVIFNSIAKYQVQDPSDEQIGSAKRVLGLSPSQIRKNDRDQWERVTALILRHDGSGDQRENEQQIADYVRSQTDQVHGGGPIASTTWGGLVKASDQWHRYRVHVAMRQRIEREMARNNGKIRAWNSLIPAQEIASMKVSPLTSVLDLYQEGQEMQHCVGSYGDHCQSGRSRIFSIRGGNGVRATVDLRRDTGKWIPVQVRGVLNAKVSSEVAGIAEEIAKLYQGAWDDTRQDERNKELWIAPSAIPNTR